MPKLNTFNGEDRLNFLLSLVGFLQNRGPVSIAEAAQHFELSVEYVRKAVTSINEARADINGFEEWFFMIDLDALEEEGMLSLTDNLVLDGAPRLSTRQTSAIAAGAIVFLGASLAWAQGGQPLLLLVSVGAAWLFYKEQLNVPALVGLGAVIGLFLAR